MQNTERKFHWVTLITIVVSIAAVADDLPAVDTVEPSARAATYDWSELIQPPPTGASQQQRDSFASFTEALANESYSEADIAAKQSVKLVDAATTDAVSARARALHNLAIAQQLLGSHESAMQNFSAALDLISSEDDNLSPALIMPLRGLALTQLDSGRPYEAFETFDRALHVSNVNFGPHSFKQLPILNAKLEHYVEQGDVSAALDLQDRILMIHTRKYGRNSEELLPAVYQQAELYGQLGMHGAEYRAWRHILAIKQEHYAKNDLALIEPNIVIAQHHIRDLRKINYRAVTTSPAEKHLRKALWIAENSPEDDWEVKKDCLLAIADFYTLFDLKGRARRYYAAAWELMSSNENYLVARAENLEIPVPLARPSHDRYANFEYNPNRDEVDPDDYLDGEITVEFTVDDRGRTRDLRIVAAEPPNFLPMEGRVLNAVEEFVYRPRYEDGKAAETRDQRYRAEYLYTPIEYQASVEKYATSVFQRRSRNRRH